MKEKRVEFFSFSPCSGGCSQHVEVILLAITNWLRSINHCFLLRDGAAFQVRIAPEYVVPGLVARLLSPS
jgi:hypothetical protein